MNMLPILLAICTDTGSDMLCSSSNFNNFCGCRDKPDDDDKLTCSIVKLSESQSSTSRVSSQYAMLCTTPSSSSSSSVSTDDVSCASTDNVSDISTDDVSSSCVSVHNAMICTTPPSCSSFRVPHKAAILGTGRILAKLCRMRWKLLSGKV